MALNVVSHNRYEKSPLNRVKIEPSSPSMENGKKKKYQDEDFYEKKGVCIPLLSEYKKPYKNTKKDCKVI